MSQRDLDHEVASMRTPPHSVEAEQSVLGGLLLDNRAWDRAAELLSEGDFYRHEHRLIFAAVASLMQRNRPADVVTVFEQLQREGKADDAGGLSHLNSLAQSVPGAANMRRYAEIVRERAVLRSIIAATNKAADLAWASTDVETTLDQVGALFGQLACRQVRQEPKLLADLIPAALDRITARADGTAAIGIKTGIAPLDRLINGLAPGKLIGIAARPGVGKSAVARAICMHAAGQGATTLLLSQEMTQEEVVECVLAGLGGINSQSIQTGNLDDGEWSALTDAAERGAALPLHVDEEGGLTLATIRAKARAIRGLQLLALDYLQLSKSTLKGATTNDQIAEISKGLKALAMELKIPIIVLSQLNREVEKNVDREPQLHNLRDSGAIEQDLDIAVLLWTAREFDQGARRIVGWKVAKHRAGPRGRFAMELDAPRYRWTESTADLRQTVPTSKNDL